VGFHHNTTHGHLFTSTSLTRIDLLSLAIVASAALPVPPSADATLVSACFIAPSSSSSQAAVALLYRSAISSWVRLFTPGGLYAARSPALELVAEVARTQADGQFRGCTGGPAGTAFALTCWSDSALFRFGEATLAYLDGVSGVALPCGASPYSVQTVCVL